MNIYIQIWLWIKTLVPRCTKILEWMLIPPNASTYGNSIGFDPFSYHHQSYIIISSVLTTINNDKALSKYD